MQPEYVSAPSIPVRLSKLLNEVSKNEKDNPRFALLCCRMIAEAVLMMKHAEKVKTGEIKNIISLGEINSKSFGLHKEFNELQKSSFDFINRSTSIFLHFNYEEPDIPSNLVQRVLDELDYLLQPIMIEQAYHSLFPKEPDQQIVEPTNEKNTLGWKELLELELGNYTKKILTKQQLKGDMLRYQMGVSSSTNPEKTSAYQYVNGIKELIKLNVIELYKREKALLKSILIIYYQKYGGPKFDKEKATISGRELRMAMVDANCICGPFIIRGAFLKHGSKHASGNLTLIGDWDFMKLK